MTPLEFLRAVWPDQGLYCIATPFPNKGYNHKVFETVDDAAAYVASVASAENVFFATHVLTAPRVWNQRHHQNKETKEWEGGWSVRLQTNARASRVLFFDLDVGSDKGYASQKDAALDLIRFVNETQLPKPMVVSSGGGLHVYWILDRELDSATEWFTLASRLRQIAAAHVLKFDPARTTDTSSVLRVAGTFNLKAGGRRPVKVEATSAPINVENFEARILAALSNADILPKAAKVVPSILDELGSNTKKPWEGSPPQMKTLLTVCKQMQNIAHLDGGTSEPEWYHGAIGVTLFTDGGRNNVHKLTKKYPSYDHDTTEAKIDQYLAKATGPTTCEKLESVCGHAEWCAACPFVKRGSSPIVYASNTEKAPPPVIVSVVDDIEVVREITDPPMPYKRTLKGGIAFLKESKDGKQYEEPIYSYDLYPLARSSNLIKETEQQTWRVHLPYDTVRDFTVDASTFVDDRALQARLANNGVYATKFPELKQYMSAYIQELQRLEPVSVQHNQLGWTKDKSQFILPGKALVAQGAPLPVTLSNVAQGAGEFVGKAGTLAEQIRLLHFFDDPAYVPNQTYILASLASIVFYATGHNGVILNAAGEMGSSKSTALYTAASFWGPPKHFTLNGTKNGATALARDTRMEILASLPTCIDEITNIAADVAKDFAMNVSQAGPRERLERDGTPKKKTVEQRSNIVMTTANISLYSLLAINNAAGGAGAVRVFEIMFEKRGIHLPAQANEFLRGIDENYGHIGERFAQVVLTNLPAIVKRVRKVQDELGAKGGIRDEERFWFAAAACILVVGALAVRMGFICWDMAAIEKWLLDDQLLYMRGTVKEELESTSPASVLMDYLEHINGNMVKRLTPINGMGQNTLQKPETVRELLAHYDLTNKLKYVLKDGFRRFCERRGLYSQALLRQLHKDGVVPAMDIKRVLGQGTELAKGRSTCFSIDMSHQAIADVQLAIVAPVAATNVITFPATAQTP